MRYVIPILGVLALIGGLAFVKASQIGMLIKAGQAAEQAGPPPEVVDTAKAKEATWESTLAAVGTVESVKGVTLSNDAPGVVTAIRFESGDVVKRGQVLVELDTSVERAQLASISARKELATTTLNRSRALVAANALPGAQLESDESLLKTTSADISALQAQIERKVVRAPFAGRLGIRAVNIGQYLNPGTSLTVLESIDSLFVDFTLPQQRLAEVAVGMPVRLIIDGAERTVIDAKVSAIDPTVDASTRMARLRAEVGNKDQRLRPGMFLNVEVVLPKSRTVVAVPATAVVHAPFGDSIFIVEDGAASGGAAPAPAAGAKAPKVARQQFVRLGVTRGDFVAIEDGLKAGQEVVVAGAFKLRNGAGIVINDAVKLDPQLNPRPDNR